MRTKGLVYIFLVVAALSSCGSSSKERYRCDSKEACLSDPDCLCWCSQICNWRKKTAQDHPVYIKNDPNGKFCYCKQWDFDHYNDNCILNKNVKQAKGSK